MFRSEHVDPEIDAEYSAEWWDYIEAFISMVNFKHGHLEHYPFSGGYYEQPQRTMWILQCISGQYRRVMAEAMKTK